MGNLEIVLGGCTSDCCNIDAYVAANANEMKAAEFKGAEGRAVGYLTNELAIIECCAANAERVGEYEKRFEVSSTSVASNKAICIANACGAVGNAKGPLHEGLPPGCMSGGHVDDCCAAKAERAVKYEINPLESDYKSSGLGKRFKASSTSVVSKKAVYSANVHNLAYQYGYIGSAADLSEKDFVSQYIGLSGPLASHESPLKAEMNDQVLKNVVDWMQQGAVNPIKD